MISPGRQVICALADLFWVATAGRTTLAGEGLQHQDGHSLLMFIALCLIVLAYDPTFAYELAVIIHDGLDACIMIKKMFFIISP